MQDSGAATLIPGVRLRRMMTVGMSLPEALAFWNRMMMCAGCVLRLHLLCRRGRPARQDLDVDNHRVLYDADGA